MPRTLAPLTLEYRAEHDGWLVLAPEGYQHGGRYIATFAEEADARAFVALPALIDAVKLTVLMFKRQAHNPENFHGDDEHEAWSALEAALAAADGPAPKEQP